LRSPQWQRATTASLFEELAAPNYGSINRRIVLALLAGWFPLAAFSAFRQLSSGDASFWYFAGDAGAHTRFLIAVPLLIAAESWCLRREFKLLKRFIDCRIVAPEDREPFNTVCEATGRLSRSGWVELVIVLVAYSLTFALSMFLPAPALSNWHVADEGLGARYTGAGIWHVFVSLPLLIFLLLLWLWRQVLWCRVLWAISRLKLRLIVTHPDRAGGLAFIGGALQGYWPLCFAVSSIVAGRISDELRAGSTLYDSRYFLVGVTVAVLLLFLMPFAVFVPVLRKLRERGSAEYGRLGLVMGRQFENGWLREPRGGPESMLARQDFSSAADLFSVIDRVYRIRYFPINTRPIAELALAGLSPFIPLVLSVVPLDVFLKAVTKLLL
jgi:hypothetical protein